MCIIVRPWNVAEYTEDDLCVGDKVGDANEEVNILGSKWNVFNKDEFTVIWRVGFQGKVCLLVE
jgi:hypothetical protein